MGFQNVKGTRDFYPDEMRRRNWIMDTWRRASRRAGFEEYDAPIFEYLDLFTAKSGPEIAEQLFSFTDRGERNLALRPEITPSLARMVNARINALPRPIKWFSMPRLCRAENPQKGRLREFFQWNVDIIGEDSPLADAECVFVAVDALRELGLTSGDVVVRYSSRALLSEVLRELAAGDAAIPAILAALDRRSKIPPEAFAQMLSQAMPDAAGRTKLLAFLDGVNAEGDPAGALARAELPRGPKVQKALDALAEFRGHLDAMGIAPWCAIDAGIVRGLAYYTGIVYEIFDRSASLRALAGGGRYDNLLEVLGGPAVGATGMGMGDVVLGILLEEKGLVPAEIRDAAIEYFVVADGENAVALVPRVAAAIRAAGCSADFSYRRGNLGKQLQQANRRKAARAVIVQGETLAVKEFSTGQQQTMTLDDFLNALPSRRAGC